VADDFVRHQDHRDAKALGEIERLHGQGKAFAHAGGAEGDDRLVAVASPAHLHDVGLRRLGRKAGAGTGALHVHDHARHLAHDREPEVFLHEGKAGTACRCHTLGAGEGGTDNGAHARDLIFHLNERAVHLRQPD